MMHPQTNETNTVSKQFFNSENLIIKKCALAHNTYPRIRVRHCEMSMCGETFTTVIAPLCVTLWYTQNSLSYSLKLPKYKPPFASGPPV